MHRIECLRARAGVRLSSAYKIKYEFPERRNTQKGAEIVACRRFRDISQAPR